MKGFPGILLAATPGGLDAPALCRTIDVGARSDLELTLLGIVETPRSSHLLLRSGPISPLTKRTARCWHKSVDPVIVGDSTPRWEPWPTRVPRRDHGHTAESTLRSVGCSVLTIKPEGLETPVRLAESRSRRRS